MQLRSTQYTRSAPISDGEHMNMKVAVLNDLIERGAGISPIARHGVTLAREPRLIQDFVTRHAPFPKPPGYALASAAASGASNLLYLAVLAPFGRPKPIVSSLIQGSVTRHGHQRASEPTKVLVTLQPPRAYGRNGTVVSLR
ncbi:hypothetical protein M407DRAFT_4754 [Tulasnella calospora MUT 4182]|uniref:Uncharacterized protein n=1 Tax=Tulasnella calospora MUT 4182 TaxID=1051891 RepID=A0A0C3QUE2_9AGAM|nr:hypothetical protein M407DRAFT_4754 [Tulasnella calospora MUT 4182]